MAVEKNKWLFLNQILVNKDPFQGLDLHNRESPFLCMLAGLKGEGRSYTTIACCLVVVRGREVCAKATPLIRTNKWIEPFKEYKIVYSLFLDFK